MPQEVHLKVGVPRETKVHESRVGVTPAGVDRLVAAGHEVVVEREAGTGSGLPDEAYEAAGARLVKEAAEVWESCELIVKVQEPLEDEWPRVREGQSVFTFFHLAAHQELTEAMRESGAHCFAYETLAVGKTLPLLTPMSEVAGRMAVLAGAQWLERSRGGSGVLLGGVPGVDRAHVLVLGGGVAGTQAARTACGLGADVTQMDVNLDRLRYLDEVMPRNCRLLYSTPLAVREALPWADVIVGAVLIPGAPAPTLVRRDDLKRIRPGSVIVDLAVDQGGCIETAKPTTHAEPVFTVEGVTHYCVANMPGAVPRTSTFALNNVTLPFTIQLAEKGAKQAMLDNPHLLEGLNVHRGMVTYDDVALALGYDYVPAAEALAR